MLLELLNLNPNLAWRELYTWNMIVIIKVEILLLFTTILRRELHFVITAVVEINFCY